MRLGGLGVVVLLVGCGGAMGSANEAPRAAGLDPAAFLQEVGAESSVVLRAPERPSDAIDEERRAARGAERRRLMRDLAVALMFEAEAADDREARRLRRRVEQTVDAAARGNRDAQLAAELDFVKLWMAWRTGFWLEPNLWPMSRSAGRRSPAARFRFRI